MARYFFHLLSPEGRSDDTLGCEFDSPDAAYLEASRAALEMATERLARREDPSGLAFQICDEALGPVMELPFREVLARPGRPLSHFAVVRESLHESAARGGAANRELSAGIERAREALDEIRATLRLFEQ